MLRRRSLAEPAPNRSLRNPPWPKIGAVVAVLVLLATAHRFGVFQQFGDPAQVKQTLVQLGPWGYAAFVAAFATLQPFGVPGTVFIFAAPLIWSWPIAFALSMVGTMAASVVGFSFSRFVARDWVAGRIPARFRKFDDALARRAFATVFLLRIVFWMPPLLHAFFGVSKVRFWTHFWASLAGYVLPLFLVSFFGPKLLDTMRRAPTGVWIAVGVGVVVVALATWMFKRRTTTTDAS